MFEPVPRGGQGPGQFKLVGQLRRRQRARITAEHDRKFLQSSIELLAREIGFQHDVVETDRTQGLAQGLQGTERGRCGAILDFGQHASRQSSLVCKLGSGQIELAAEIAYLRADRLGNR